MGSLPIRCPLINIPGIFKQEKYKKIVSYHHVLIFGVELKTGSPFDTPCFFRMILFWKTKKCASLAEIMFGMLIWKEIQILV